MQGGERSPPAAAEESFRRFPAARTKRSEMRRLSRLRPDALPLSDRLNLFDIPCAGCFQTAFS